MNMAKRQARFIPYHLVFLLLGVSLIILGCRPDPPDVEEILETLNKPVFYPVDGTTIPAAGLDVILVGPMDGSMIRYTLDGSDPTPTSGTEYSALIHLTDTTTIKAIAVKDGMANSEIVAATYTKEGQVVAPRFSYPDGSSFVPSAASLTVSLESDTPGATIYYTMDQSATDPFNPAVYASPLTLTKTTVLKAVAKKQGMIDSQVVTARYIALGTIQWNFPTDYEYASSPALDSNGTIYFHSTGYDMYDKLHALNPDGTVKWEFQGQTINNLFYKNVSSPAIGSDGVIFLGSLDGNLYAINPDGTKKWNFSAGNSIVSSPAIGSDGVVYFGSCDENLYAINPDGTKKWNFDANGRIISSPAIGADGVIYVGSWDKNLYAINPNGTKKWNFLTNDVIYSSPALGSDGVIYVGSYDKNLYAINPDGTKKWNFSVNAKIISSPAIGSDGVIYFGSCDGNLYAINPDGTKKWNYVFSLPAGSTAQPSNELVTVASTTLGSDGTIYTGTTLGSVLVGKFYAIRSDGTKKWEIASISPGLSCAAVGSDGTIYIGGYDGGLYAITDSGPLANTPWPKFGKNNQHTSR